MKTENKIEIKYIELETAKKLHKELEEMLEKADNKKIFNYDINAHSDFCAAVVKIIDIMIGQVIEQYDISRKESRSKNTRKRK